MIFIDGVFGALYRALSLAILEGIGEGKFVDCYKRKERIFFGIVYSNVTAYCWV